ncbi:MAG: hypothetical protein H0U76_30090 [Ktedonobacteraceae bacterium]|nr:hypothetical protein [Ktedonobacteraceae bacterium]
MTSNLSPLSPGSLECWQMPVVPEQYDRKPLTDEERWALEHFAAGPLKPTGSRKTAKARQILARFNSPIADVFFLRHQGRSLTEVAEVHCVLRREMYQRNKTFWEWSPQEWVDVLCPNVAVFNVTRGRGKKQNYRTTLMDMGYLLGGVTDLRLAGIGYEATPAANLYFGTERVAEQCQRVLDMLVGNKQLGYKAGKAARSKIQQYLSTVFLLQRSSQDAV